jgi:hypothetical protein
MVQHLTPGEERRLASSRSMLFRRVRPKGDVVILSETGVPSARRIPVRWGGEAKNLSSLLFAPTKERFLVARKKQVARIPRVELKPHPLLRMIPLAQISEEECVG